MSHVLLDTNILLRSSQPSHPMFQAAIDAQFEIRKRGDQPCLIVQNLYEFRVVATRPVNVNGLGMSQSQVNAEITRLKTIYRVFPDLPAIFTEWEHLVTRHVSEGKQNHDARIVAAMIVHGISNLLTFNDSDFLRYSEINVLTP